MDEKEENQDHNTTNTITPNKKESPRKAIIIGGDRLKRDEWSEGAVSTLLDAYEAKWVLRNRAKLKGQDWEDVARYVSSRANSTKSPKTQTQCKNKIESMKKRYRSESATTADASTWPLYSRLHLLLRGTGPVSTILPPPPSQSPYPTNNNNQALMLLEPLLAVSQPPPLAAPPPHATAQNSHASIAVDRLAKEDGLGNKSCDEVSKKNPLDTADSSTPHALYSEKDNLRWNNKNNNKKKKKKMKMESNSNKRQRKEEMMDIGESIRWVAEVVVRSEETRMETLKEIERMRVEAEAKRSEMDLKRTEIIANTQLQIANIFATLVNKGSNVDSSLRIGRS